MAKINPNINQKKPSPRILDVEALSMQIVNGDRYALSKAITLIESENEDDESKADELLSHMLKTGRSSFRIGISGAPGAGKSTLIDALGIMLVEAGKRPAILAIDPSSTVTGGSILGDKTRMERLTRSEKAFIRPSPAGKTLGGVARKTRETIILLEAAGYDPVIVETVGVGQSETMVKSMTDLFVLLIAPGAGDEIQGIKRGIIEIADIIAVNKMDGQLKTQAKETLNEYQHALSYVTKENGWKTKILGVSAIENIGLEQLWHVITDYQDFVQKSGYLTSNRESQNIKWFDDHIRSFIFEKMMSNPKIEEHFRSLRRKVQSGRISPFSAAHTFFQSLNIKNEH